MSLSTRLRMLTCLAGLLIVHLPVRAMNNGFDKNNDLYRKEGLSSVFRLRTGSIQGSAVYLGNDLFLTVLHNLVNSGRDTDPHATLRLENTHSRLTLPPDSYVILTPESPLWVSSLFQQAQVWLPDIAFIQILETAPRHQLAQIPAAQIDFAPAFERDLLIAGFGENDQGISDRALVGPVQIESRAADPMETLYQSVQQKDSAFLREGDSGGPLFRFDDQGHLRVAGLAQSFVLSLWGNRISRFTSLSHPYVRNWISLHPSLRHLAPPTADLSSREARRLLQNPVNAPAVETSCESKLRF